jgi:multidrug efflux pump subunit AcrB
VAATSSSRFTQPTYWRDPASGTAYQVQVEIPQSRIASIEDVQALPAGSSTNSRPVVPLIGDVAQLSFGTMPGEVDRYNQQRMITISANIAGTDLGSAAGEVNEAWNYQYNGNGIFILREGVWTNINRYRFQQIDSLLEFAAAGRSPLRSTS